MDSGADDFLGEVILWQDIRDVVTPDYSSVSGGGILDISGGRGYNCVMALILGSWYWHIYTQGIHVSGQG